MRNRLKNISNIFFILLISFTVAWSVRAGETLSNNSVVDNITKAVTNFRVRPAFFNKAKLADINGSVLAVEYNAVLYKVIIDETTKLMRRYGGAAKLDEFVSGQTLLVSGKRISNDTIEAKLIHNWSIEKYSGAYIGVIDNINEIGEGFVLKTTSRGELNTILDNESKILDRKNELEFIELIKGMKVVVTGLWDKNNKTLTEVSKVVILTSPTERPLGMTQKIKQGIVGFSQKLKQIEVETKSAVISLIK